MRKKLKSDGNGGGEAKGRTLFYRANAAATAAPTSPNTEPAPMWRDTAALEVDVGGADDVPVTDEPEGEAEGLPVGAADPEGVAEGVTPDGVADGDADVLEPLGVALPLGVTEAEPGVVEEPGRLWVGVYVDVRVTPAAVQASCEVFKAWAMSAGLEQWSYKH